MPMAVAIYKTHFHLELVLEGAPGDCATAPAWGWL